MFRTNNLKTKLIWSFTTIILISFLGITVCFYAYIHNFIVKDVRKSMDDLANSISNQLDSELYSLDRIALGMLGNKEFTDGLTQLNNRSGDAPSLLALEKYEFQKLVDKLIFTLNTPILTSPMISVIQPDHDYYFGWSIAGPDQPAVKSALHDIPWLSKVQEAQGAKVIIPPGQNRWTSRQDTVISLTRAIMSTKGRFLGVLEVQQSYNIIEDICASSATQRLTVVMDADDNLIYPAVLPWQDDAASALSGTEAGGELTLGDTKYVYAAAVSEYSGWRTLILYPNHAVFRNTALLFQFVLYAIIIILLVSVTAVFIISEGLTKPLRELRTKIREIDADRLNIRFGADSGDDEIHQLNMALEQMLERIDLSIKQQAQAQQEEARSYLLALQSQMNPHFLYNTLNTISVLADETGEEDIGIICRYLVEMLRYVGNYDRSQVTLAQEVQHTRQYLTLLKTRFEDNLTFTITTTGDLEAATVPKLILQPLAENCYKHGLCAIAPPWHISVDVQSAEDGITLIVRDNGGGFLPDAIAAIQDQIQNFRVAADALSEMRNLTLSNVGLLNTYSRLFLRYGHAASLQIKNLEPCGSQVVIFIPKDIPENGGGKTK